MEKNTWAPKITQTKIYRLYHNDEIGAVDDVLVEDVGLSLFLRCESIRQVTRREVQCPRCLTVFCLSDSWKAPPGNRFCPSGCRWYTSWEAWHESWRHRDLMGSAAMGAIDSYLHDYPKATTSRQKMVCIDQLIHAFHISLRTGNAGRSFANNLIEGSHKRVVEFLDGLSGFQGGVDKSEWRREMAKIFLRRRGQI